MHNIKFSNKLISLITLTYKQNNLWFNIILTRNVYSLLFIFQKIGLISNFFIFNLNFKKFIIVFLKYVELEIPVSFPIWFYFKPSHKLSINLKTLRKLTKTMGDTSLILSTPYGLKTHDECLMFGTGGFLFLIVYV